MTSVTQLLPNFIQGINDQPDELKKPGQVRDAVNVYPDVVNGLERRRGYENIAEITDIDKYQHWFSMIREDAGNIKRYVFGIDTAEGKIDGWDADTGEVQDIKWYDFDIDLSPDAIFDETKIIDQPNIEYFQNTTQFREAIQNDAVFITNKTMDVSMSSTNLQERPYEAFVEITTLDVTRAYTINLDIVGSDQVDRRVATKVKAISEREFFGAGFDDDCEMVGNYNLEATETEDGRSRGQPIKMRISIGARPSPVSYTHLTLPTIA